MADTYWTATFLIALYGAGLSTYQAWLRHLERYPKLLVTFHPVGMVELTPGVGKRDIIWIRVANVGAVEVFFKRTNTDLEIQGQSTRFLLNDPICDIQFPAVLKRGDAFTLASPTEKFWDELRTKHGTGFIRIRANVWDAVHKVYSSRWVDLDLKTLKTGKSW